MKYGMHWRFPKVWNAFFIFFRECVIFFFFFFQDGDIKKAVFFHTSSWWHSLRSMQNINRWKLFLMCHCLSKTGIGSTDDMTSTWLCQIYHMAVSLAIKKNWQETIAVAKQRSWFSISEPDCANFDSFCAFETRWLAQARCSPQQRVGVYAPAATLLLVGWWRANVVVWKGFFF